MAGLAGWWLARGCECQLIRAVDVAMAHVAASVLALPWGWRMRA